MNLKYAFITSVLFLGCSNHKISLNVENSNVQIHDPYFEGEAKVTGTSKGFKIALNDSKGRELDRAIFNYQPYQLDTADVNRDGRTDILIGLIKPTEFDPQENRRLFILQIDDGQLRPLWLGSKVCQQLVDFRAMKGGIIRTLEQTKRGNYCVGIYEWQGFGLTLIRYVSDEKTYNEANEVFNS